MKLLKKNKVRGLILPNFKTYYKATVIKAEWHKDRYIHQQNRLENPEIDHFIYGQLIFNQVYKLYNGERIISLTNDDGKLNIHMEKMDGYIL